MALSPAHEVMGLAVYQKAGGVQITMATVHEVMDELAGQAVAPAGLLDDSVLTAHCLPVRGW